MLDEGKVEAVADVRRFPGSRRNPQFNAEPLAVELARAGIAYETFGEELGGRRRSKKRSPNEAWRVAAFRAYADHMATPQFAAGLDRLEQLARAKRTTVMCAEGDWRRCHRRLIADAFTARGWRVVHIRPDGELESHELPLFAQVESGRVTYPKG